MNKKFKQKVKRGFTLVETSLATALISILLLAVAMIIINVVSIYRKGMTMKTMNSVGRTLIEDINTAIASSSPGTIVAEGEDTTLASVNAFETNYYRHYDSDLNDTNKTPRGAFCLGTYSYLWQTFSGRSKSLKVKYKTVTGSTGEISEFRLLKIRDPRQLVCTSLTDTATTLDLTSIEVDSTSSDYSLSQEPEELLMNTDIEIVVYGLSVSAVNNAENLNQDTDTGNTQVFFSGVITLGTTTDIEASGNTGETNSLRLDSEACDTSQADMSGNVSAFDYCAVNRFKFSARAGSSS